MPTIPLWLGLAAAIPLTWSPLQVYFVITLIVSLLGWTGLAREVRGRFFALRGEDFVTAARLDGSSERRVIFRHILPSLTSHILAVVTLAIPTMIVAETALSFLGIGLKAPVVSWGVLLQDAQNIRTIATAPWLLIWPSLAVVLAVLCLQLPRRRPARRRRPLRAADGPATTGRRWSPAQPTSCRCSRCATSSIDFHLRTHILHAVRDVSFDLLPRPHARLVGESGSGKSVTARALLRIIDKHGTHRRRPRSCCATPTAARPTSRRSTERAARSARIRGGRIGLIFQEPMTSLSPVHTIGARSSRRCACIASMDKRAGPRRDDRAAAPGRDPEPRGDGRPLHLRVLGRHAAARDDRHGARRRPRHPDRRRADHRARRDHAGRNPRPHQAAAGQRAAWRCC